jgi:tetrahydromethanopterin S-methyltransferase subunit G
MTKKLIITIEDLAELIYETMASKEDVEGVRGDIQVLEDRVTTRFDSVESRLDHLDARVRRIEADVHGLCDEMIHRQEFQDALDRIKYIEKKLDIESGV